MKVVVGHDMDGHFHVFKIENRKEIFEFIKDDLDDGDAWANSDYSDDFSYIKLSYEEWIDFINDFVSRGSLEIIDFA